MAGSSITGVVTKHHDFTGVNDLVSLSLEGLFLLIVDTTPGTTPPTDAFGCPVVGDPTLNITNNSVNSADVDIVLIFSI